jgi:hypothetical protein
VSSELTIAVRFCRDRELLSSAAGICKPGLAMKSGFFVEIPDDSLRSPRKGSTLAGEEQTASTPGTCAKQ